MLLRVARNVLWRGRVFVRARTTPSAVVLMYHRVAEERIDPWRMCVRPDHFRAHLSILRRRRIRLVTVAKLAEELREGRIRRPTCAVTFDDGYADNLLQAKPLLQRYEAPATVFVTSGQIGAEEEFWWDAVDRVFLEAVRLPRLLELRVGDEPKSFDLGEDAFAAARASGSEGWKPFRTPPTRRHAVHDEVWSILFRSSAAERRRLVQCLLEWAGLQGRPRPSRRAMDEAEVRRLAADGLVEVGAHGVTHSPFDGLAQEEQRAELTGSKAQLESILGKPVRGIAFPHGRLGAATMDLVGEAGFEYACTSRRARAARDDLSGGLPRFAVGDWDGGRFAKFLTHAFGA